MSDDYDRQWSDLRLRTRLVQGAGLLFLPSMMLSIEALNRVAPGPGEQWVLLPFGIWAIFLGWLVYRQISFPCPHCGGWFGSRDAWASPIARHCLHCGQRRYGAPGEDVH